MDNFAPSRENDIYIYDRGRAELSGIDDVLEFSDTGMTLSCDTVTLTIEGRGMKITSFDSSNGKLTVVGTIDSVFYFGDADSEKRSKRRRA